MDPFGLTPEQYSAGAAWASVLVLVVTGGLIYRQVREAQRLRLEQSRPFVVVRWHMQRWLIQLRVENLGQMVAHDIRVTFDEPLTSAAFPDKDFTSLNMFKNGIPMLAPRQAMTVHVDVSHQRPESELPMTYTATAEYKDGQGREYGPDVFTLDLDVYMDTALAPRGIPEIAQELETIRKEISKWKEGASGGLRVYALNADRYRRRQNRPSRIGRARRVLETDGVPGLVSHLVRQYRRRRGLYSPGR